MIVNLKQFILVFILVFLGSNLFGSSLPKDQLAKLYEDAVHDASIPKKGEIASDLIAIKPTSQNLVWNEDKTKILVVTWKSKSSYERFLNTRNQTNVNEDYVIWVTTVPQVQNFCHGYILNNSDAKVEEINIRLKQYLGLNPTWQYDVFVEMWVSPKDVFRPCVDPEINDSKCNLNFGKTIPVVKGIKNYPAFYKNLYYSDFRTLTGVPWTGLGYTFDWGNPLTEQGASEFILIPGANYKIEQVTLTIDYCNKSKKE